MTDIIEIIQPESVVVEVAEAVGPRGPKGNPGPPGERGPAGEPGAKGEPGVGVPTGGTVGEVLVKKSGTDFDTEWAPAGVVSVNGKTGVVTLDAADVGALPDDYAPAWGDVEGKPDAFPPAAHTHPVADVTGLADVAVSGDYGDLNNRPAIPSAPGDIGAQPAGDYVTDADPRLTDAREPLAHTHPIDDVTGLDQALAGKADTGDLFTGDYDDLTNKPDLFDPAVGDPGDVLTTVDGEWVAAPVTGGSGLPPTGVEGDVLTTVGGEWTAAAPTGGGADIPPGDDVGDVLTWDGTEWAGAAPTGGLPSRQTTVLTTASLPSKGRETGTIELAPAYRLLRITVDKPARIRFYTNTAKRNQDLDRPVGEKPTGDNGRLFEFISTTEVPAVDLSPTVDGFVADGTVDVPYTVDLLGSSSGVVNVSLIWVRTE